MADLLTKTFPDLVQGEAAAAQSSASGLVDVSVGSILRATLEAVAGVALWLQGLILVLLTTRFASTSTGADLDSWIADFCAGPNIGDATLFARYPAVPASGAVTFSRLTTGQQVVVPVGATVSLADGSQNYVVTTDPTNGAYNAGLGGYVIGAGATSVTVPVAAQTAGAASNAVAGAINTISAAVPGVDAVTNALDFTNGADAETDAALRPRFRAFVAALASGTPAAIKYAVQGLQRGVSAKVVENLNFDGSANKGFVYALVDDGTGFPSSALLTAAAAAMDVVHPAGVQFAAYAPTVVPINVVATLVTRAGADHAAAVVAAAAAVRAYINAAPISTTIYVSRVWQVLQDASSDIVEVTGLTVNTGSADVTMTTNQVGKSGTITLT